MQIPVGMHTANDMNFGDGWFCFFNPAKHFVYGKFPTFFTFLFGKRAKTAVVYADIGGLDMDVPVKIGNVSVFVFSHVVSQHSKQPGLGLLPEQKSFFGSDALKMENFVGNGFEIVGNGQVLGI